MKGRERKKGGEGKGEKKDERDLLKEIQRL